MTPLRNIVGTPGYRLLLLACLLLTFGQLAVLVTTVRKRQGKVHVITAAIHLLLGFFLLVTLFEPASPEEAYPVPVRVLYDRPWLIYLGLFGLSALLLAVSIQGGLLFRSNRPSPAAIKQTVDLLPTALCVSEENGRVLLTNVNMSRLCGELTGTLLNDANRLWQAVADRGEPRDGRYLVRTQRGQVLLFARDRMTTQVGDFVQITAADVTEQYRITCELQEKNRRLRETQSRMKVIDERESCLLVSREIMNARATVHNQLGSILLTGKYYLDHPDSADEAEVLHMLALNNELLLGQTEPPDALGDPVENAMRKARGIGVTVEFSGPQPRRPAQRGLLAQAIDQCAANAVRHAGANRLRVELRRFGGELQAVFTNNGNPPVKPVRETGGLAALRREAQGVGVRMTISDSPVFSLLLGFPDEA